LIIESNTILNERNSGKTVEGKQAVEKELKKVEWMMN
jgi:hypothetical protein